MRIAFRKRIGSAAIPVAWTPDGHALVFMVAESPGDFDVWTVSLAGERVAIPTVKKPGNQIGGQISPDGRWLAYTSDESGQFEIYVTRFPSGSGAVPVSSGGGMQAVWARNGRELFFRNGWRLMTVAVDAADEFKAGKPAVLFDGKYLRGVGGAANFDVSADGSTFVMISTAAEDAAVRHVNVILNWGAELSRAAVRSTRERYRGVFSCDARCFVQFSTICTSSGGPASDEIIRNRPSGATSYFGLPGLFRS